MTTITCDCCGRSITDWPTHGIELKRQNAQENYCDDLCLKMFLFGGSVSDGEAVQQRRDSIAA